MKPGTTRFQTADLEHTRLECTARSFALRVEGDGLAAWSIADGDVIVCEHGVPPRPGDLVAAWVDNEPVVGAFETRRTGPVLRLADQVLPAGPLLLGGVVRAVVRRLTGSSGKFMQG